VRERVAACENVESLFGTLTLLSGLGARGVGGGAAGGDSIMSPLGETDDHPPAMAPVRPPKKKVCSAFMSGKCADLRCAAFPSP
jgi:hypothetical protein